MTDSVVLVVLVVSCTASFGLGRLILHICNKKRQATQDQSVLIADRIRRTQSPEPPSKNKSKRRRQLQGKSSV